MHEAAEEERQASDDRLRAPLRQRLRASLKDFIDNDHFGDIYYAKATYLRRKGCPGGWFGDKARSGGGPLIDLGVHVIDLTPLPDGQSDQPVSVYGATFNKLGDRHEHERARSSYQSMSRSEGGQDIFNVEDHGHRDGALSTTARCCRSRPASA